MGLRCREADFAHASVADVAELRLTTYVWTLCIRADSQPGTGETWTFLGKGGYDNTTKGSYIGQYIDTGGVKSLKFGFWDNTAGAAVSVSGDYTLTTGLYYSIALKYVAASGASRIWIAARETPSNPTAASAYTAVYSGTGLGTNGPATTGTQAIRFGCGVTAAGLVQEGASMSISEAALYTGDISQSTLEGRLGTRLVGTESGLIGYWRFDDGEGGVGGSTAYDRCSGTGRNATLQNRPAWTDNPLDLHYPHGITSFAFLGIASGTRRQSATITASNEATGYPATNLRRSQQVTTTRTSASSGQPVITAMLHSADSWAGPAVSESVTLHPDKIIHIFTRPYQYRYARLQIVDGTATRTWTFDFGARIPITALSIFNHNLTSIATDNYIELGTCDWWIAIDLWRHPDLGSEVWSIHDPSTSVESTQRARTTRTLTPSWDVSFSVLELRRAQALAVRRALEEAAGGGPILACLDVRRRLYSASIYGYATTLPAEKLTDPSWDRVDLVGLGITADRP